MITIPETVLDVIATHRPHLAQMIANLRATPARAAQIEKAIATNVLQGAVDYLGTKEMADLAHCATGKSYGGEARTGHNARGAGRPATGTAKVMLQVRVAPDLRTRIARAAEREDVTDTEIVTRALEAYLIDQAMRPAT